MRHFMVRDARKNEEHLLLTDYKDDQICCEKSALGTFSPEVTMIHDLTDNKNPEMRSELEELLRQLKCYGKPLLKSGEAMAEFCRKCFPVAPLRADNCDAYGFVSHSEKYVYYILCCVEENVNESHFYIRCYNRKSLIDAGILQDDEVI